MADKDGVMRDAAELDEAKTAAADAQAMSEEDRLLLEKYSRTLTGSYYHSLDAKGRMVVPLVFRESLGSTFYIAPSYDFKSIALYPNLMWARMRDHYEKLSKVNRSLKRYLEQLDALSFRGQECDGQGRVLIPAKIRACILGEDKDVEITGANDHVRVIARVKGDDVFSQFMEDMPDILGDLDELEKQYNKVLDQ